jgi:hypothetical protein
MPRSKPLSEGMRAGDLRDLVLPVVSVDEYESKVDAKAVVFGFYVHDLDAARDLDRFIQRSSLPLIDTDISPAPDQHGYYLVFVEMLNDTGLPKHVEALIREVALVSGTEEWSVSLRGTPSVRPYSKDLMTKFLTKMRRKSLEERALEFLASSELADAEVTRGRVTIGNLSFALIECERNLLRKLWLVGLAEDVDLHTTSLCARLVNMLGEDWSAFSVSGTIILSRLDDDRLLALRK